MTTTNSNPLSITALSDYDGPTMNKNPMKVTIVGGGGGSTDNGTFITFFLP